MSQYNDTTKPRRWKHLSEKERYKIEILLGERLTAGEIGRRLNRDRRTIEREIARGMTRQRNSDLTERTVYLADAGQRVHEERAANKGRGLKIGHDHKLAAHIEEKIKKDRWSPDAVIGDIKNKGMKFATSICTV